MPFTRHSANTSSAQLDLTKLLGQVAIAAASLLLSGAATLCAAQTTGQAAATPPPAKRFQQLTMDNVPPQ